MAPPPPPPPPPSTAAVAGNNVSEDYRSLVDKAYQKFARLRELPPYGRNKWDLYFKKAFQVYSKLWKFQQDHRSKLVETGLKRWEIGEIASRVGQLYYNYYLRKSEAVFLYESFIFYEAILTREYFKDSSKEIALSNKQLRYLARFIVVCLLLNRRDVVRQLLKQLKGLVEEYGRTFQAGDAKEWRLMVQEIVRFMKADAACEGLRPLRYSIVLDPDPSLLSHIPRLGGAKALKLQEAVLTSYYHNEVKFSEMTLDTFRMLQAIEWEPSGAFLKLNFFESSGGISSSSSSTTRGGGSKGGGGGGGGGATPSRVGGIEENIVDPSLPSNPHKHLLYRPSVSQLLVVLATACEDLPPDSALLLYISSLGGSLQGSALTQQHAPVVLPGSSSQELQHQLPSSSSSPSSFVHPQETGQISGRSRGDYAPRTLLRASGGQQGGRDAGGEGGVVVESPHSSLRVPGRSISLDSSVGSKPPRSSSEQVNGLWLGSRREVGRDREGRRGDGGAGGGGGGVEGAKSGIRAPWESFLYPADLLPFTRKPLFLIIDSDMSCAFESISGEERGEPAALLLSPQVQPAGAGGDEKMGATSQVGGGGGNLFTYFLTAPLLAFCRLVGRQGLISESASMYETAERQLSSLLAGWGASLASMPGLEVAWARVLSDPFLRQFIVRFVFCRAVFGLHGAYSGKPEFQPNCCPPLPIEMLPTSESVHLGVRRLASILTCADQFDTSSSVSREDAGIPPSVGVDPAAATLLGPAASHDDSDGHGLRSSEQQQAAELVEASTGVGKGDREGSRSGDGGNRVADQRKGEKMSLQVETGETGCEEKLNAEEVGLDTPPAEMQPLERGLSIDHWGLPPLERGLSIDQRGIPPLSDDGSNPDILEPGLLKRGLSIDQRGSPNAQGGNAAAAGGPGGVGGMTEGSAPAPTTSSGRASPVDSPVLRGTDGNVADLSAESPKGLAQPLAAADWASAAANPPGTAGKAAAGTVLAEERDDGRNGRGCAGESPRFVGESAGDRFPGSLPVEGAEEGEEDKSGGVTPRLCGREAALKAWMEQGLDRGPPETTTHTTPPTPPT